MFRRAKCEMLFVCVPPARHRLLALLGSGSDNTVINQLGFSPFSWRVGWYSSFNPASHWSGQSRHNQVQTRVHEGSTRLFIIHSISTCTTCQYFKTFCEGK